MRKTSFRIQLVLSLVLICAAGCGGAAPLAPTATSTAAPLQAAAPQASATAATIATLTTAPPGATATPTSAPPTPSPIPASTRPAQPEVVYFNDQGLFLAELSGGMPSLISSQASGLAGALTERSWKWSPDGERLLFPEFVQGEQVRLVIAELKTGSRVEISWTPLSWEYDFTEGYQWLPDGQAVALLSPESYFIYSAYDGRLLGQFARREYSFFQFSAAEQAVYFLNPAAGEIAVHPFQRAAEGQIEIAAEPSRQMSFPEPAYRFALSPAGDRLAVAYGAYEWEQPDYTLAIVAAQGGDETIVHSQSGARVEALSWSPDSAWLGLLSLTVAQEAYPHWMVYSYSLAEGSLHRLGAEDQEAWRFDWSPDGQQILVEQGGMAILSQPDGSQQIEFLAGVEVRAAGFRPWPEALAGRAAATGASTTELPAGLRLAYEIWNDDLTGSLVLSAPDGSQRVEISASVPWSFGPGRCTQWSPGGDRLAYIDEIDRQLKLFDLQAGMATVALAEANCTYTLHPDNRTLAKLNNNYQAPEIQLYDARDGKILAALGLAGLNYFAFSPDGKLLAYSLELNSLHFMRLNLDGQGNFVGLGPTQGSLSGLQIDSNPLWSPDGQRLAYIDNSSERSKISALGLDGGPAVTLLAAGDLPGAASIWDFNWSPDGKRLAVTTASPGGPTGQTLQLFIVELGDGSYTQLSGLPGSLAREGADPAWLSSEALIFSANPNSQVVSTVWVQADGSQPVVLGLPPRAHRVLVKPGD